jgi:hypothetical protein
MHGALLGSKHIKVNRAKIPERNKVGFGNVPWTDEGNSTTIIVIVIVILIMP